MKKKINLLIYIIHKFSLKILGSLAMQITYCFCIHYKYINTFIDKYKY